MSRLPNALRATLTIFFVLMIVLFVESARVTRYLGDQPDFWTRAAIPYLRLANQVKAKFSGTTEVFPNGTTGSTSPASSTAPIAFIKPQPPYTIIEVGDSFIAERFGVQLERTLTTYQAVTVTRDGVYSTGLSRPDYFNWNDELSKLIATQHPNVALVLFGANDAQDIRTLEGKIILHYGTPEWDAEYVTRIRAFADQLAAARAMVFWIGNPIARDAYYAKRMAHLNNLYQQALAEYPNARFVSTWDTLEDSHGIYDAYLANAAGQLRLARTSDGIHVTDFGATFLVQTVVEAMKRDLALILFPPVSIPTSSTKTSTPY